MPPSLEEQQRQEGATPQSGKDEVWVVIPTDNIFSDGNGDVWPTDSRHHIADPTHYLEKLAKMWMKQTGKFKPGQ